MKGSSLYIEYDLIMSYRKIIINYNKNEINLNLNINYL